METASDKWRSVYNSCTAPPWDGGTIPLDVLAVFDDELARRPSVLALVDYGCGRGKWLKATRSSIPRVGIDCVDRSPLIDPTTAHVVSDVMPLRPESYGLLCVGVLHHYPPEQAMAIVDDALSVVLGGVVLVGVFAPDDPAFGTRGRYLSTSTADWVYAHDCEAVIAALRLRGWQPAMMDRSSRETRTNGRTALRRWRFVLATSGTQEQQGAHPGGGREAVE